MRDGVLRVFAFYRRFWVDADFWQKAGASTWSSRIAHYTGYEIRVKEIRLPHPIFRVIGKTLFP